MRRQTKSALRFGQHWAGRLVGAVFKVLGTIILIFVTTGLMLAILGSIYVNRNMNAGLELDLNSFSLNQTSRVYYTDKKTSQPVEMETLHARENRELAKYEEIPKSMFEALIAIEDKRFYSHQGVDWKRTIGAFTNLFSSQRDTFGGSTITQQLIKNLTGDKDVTVKRKLTEIFRALEFEKHYTKEQILEWYLNTSYFGQGSYGVKVAARTYFDKELSELTVAESACIIGITNSPTRYDPFQNPEKNKKRQEDILNQMFEQGMLSEAEYDASVAEKLSFIHTNKPSERGTQSWYMDQVYLDVTEDLAAKYHVDRAVAQQMLLNGGYKIYTAIDMDIQAIIDEVFTNEENIPAVKGMEKPQAAMVLMDPYTGCVLGMAGGIGKKEGNLVFNRATQSKRQPGSSIKPVAVYAPAMEFAGATPYTVLDDTPFSKGKGGKAWPRNSNGRYKGLTTIFAGVTSSTNTMAVRTLDLVTPETSFEFLQEKLHITTLEKQDKDYAPLALGGLTKGMYVREITAAYCIFPNKGVFTKPRTYTQVTDSEGEVILDNKPQTTAAIKEKNAWYMNTVLQNVVKSGTGARAKLENGMTAAGKTGTTTDDYDRWFVGYTPYYCAGVWFGFDDPKKIALEQSTNPALALWKKVMDKVHKGLEDKDFFSIEDTKKASYCLDSGLAPSANCKLDPRGKRVATGVFYKDDVPRKTCTAHTLVDCDKVSGELATPYCPPENLQRTALLNITRDLAVSVRVEDDGYRVRYFKEGLAAAPPNPEGGAEVKVVPNGFCHLHPDAASLLPTPPPEVTFDPTLPFDPNATGAPNLPSVTDGHSPDPNMVTSPPTDIQPPVNTDAVVPPPA